jgi:hypothetical protein
MASTDEHETARAVECQRIIPDEITPTLLQYAINVEKDYCS